MTEDEAASPGHRDQRWSLRHTIHFYTRRLQLPYWAVRLAFGESIPGEPLIDPIGPACTGCALSIVARCWRAIWTAGPMSGPPAVAILDMDGVLVDLHLDGAGVRREVNGILAFEGMSVDGQGLLSGIAAACAEVGARDAQAAPVWPPLWAVIDAEETRCARPARSIPAHALSCNVWPGFRSPVHKTTTRLRAPPCTRLESIRRASSPSRRAPALNRSSRLRRRCWPSSRARSGRAERVFLVGDHVADMGSVLAARQAAPGHSSSPSDTRTPWPKCALWRRPGRTS